MFFLRDCGTRREKSRWTGLSARRKFILTAQQITFFSHTFRRRLQPDEIFFELIVDLRDGFGNAHQLESLNMLGSR